MGVSDSSLGTRLSPFSRSYDLGYDSLLEMIVVTYDGKIVKLSPDDMGGDNCDLFWAMNDGSGGDFGVTLKEFKKTMDVFNTNRYPDELALEALWSREKNKQLTGDITVICRGITSETKQRGSTRELKESRTQWFACLCINWNYIMDPEYWFMTSRITKGSMWRLSYSVFSELAKEQLIAQQPAKWREMLPRSPMLEEYDQFIDRISSNNLQRSSNNDPKKHRAERSFIALMDEAGTEKAKVKELLPGITLSNVRPYVKATSY
ncbi:hypothetical protein EDB80DRAFT_864248 [Ilyonectria destructans]|nr:hypothetical protein EDB80DRAFT_864248 [Ilyonectria destructans]